MKLSGYSKKILLCGIGGDSHSVGLQLIRFALIRQDFELIYLGTQNTLEEVFASAGEADAVLLSCMDGHAMHYLKLFPEYHQRFTSAIPWYLGGTPTLGQFLGGERLFIEMGFKRVFLNFVEIATVIDFLRIDLAHVAGRPCLYQDGLTPPKLYTSAIIPLENKMSANSFLAQRRDVLEQWPTGAVCADFAENAAFLKAQPLWSDRQFDARHAHGDPLLQPRCGVATVDGQLGLFTGLLRSSADVLSYQVDSLTRNNDYVGAADALRDSTRTVSTLNGFPVVNHGVSTLRRIARSVQVPLQCRHSTRDPRLLAEICYAGGISAFEGGAICYNIPYYKSYPIAEAIEVWQYVDRLTGFYFDEFGIILDREFFGVLTAALIPPCLAITIGIIEAILAAQQGVRAVSIGYAEQGNRSQDIAAIRMITRLARRFLDAFGYASVAISSVFHQYMAAFPLDIGRARQLIRASSTTAALSGATRMLSKTAVEAYRTPSLTENTEGLLLSRNGYGDSTACNWWSSNIEEEERYIEREVEQLMDGVIALGRGSIAVGAVKAFQVGALDIPFAPSLHNAGLASTGRDISGAIRFVDCGRLPFSREIKAFHADKIAERRRAMLIDERRDYLLIEHDLLQVARGEYKCWPLS